MTETAKKKKIEGYFYCEALTLDSSESSSSLYVFSVETL